MQATTLLLIALMGAGPGPGDYARSLSAPKLDQAALDAEGYGSKKAFQREDDGLRITLPPGDEETGWKTPQQLRFGGDFTLSADLVITKLPKPALEDGVAIGLAIAFNDVNQPDVTLLRLVETTGAEVYQTLDKASANPQQMQNPMMMMQMQMGMMMAGMQPGGKPPKAPRRTSPAAGETVRMELQREGQVVRFQVLDARSAKPRYLGQVTTQGPMDVSAVKLFVVNRNGAEAVNVLLKNLTIRADRISGLGTAVRNVFNEIVYAEPTAIENGALILGGPPKTPAQPNQNPGGPASPSAPPTHVPPAVPPGGAVLRGPGGLIAFAIPATPAVADVVQAPAAPAAAPPAEAKAADQLPADVLATGATMPSDVFAPAPGQPAQPAAAVQKPKAVIPLDEVESIRFERTPALSGRFVGQPNLDFTMPAPSEPKDDPKKAGEDEKKPNDKKSDGGDDLSAPPPGTTIAKAAKVEPKKNGIRDIQLALFGLRPAKIKQIMINCQTDKGATTWQLDTTGSQSRPLVVQRAGTEIAADLFLEPPPADCHQKSFSVNVTYEDGQAANANFQADGHSDAKLAVDPNAAAVAPPDAWVFLTGDEKLFGKLGGVEHDALRLTTPWKDQLEIPLKRITGVHISLLDRKESPESFAKRLKSRGAEDVLLAQTKNGEVIAISGVLEAVEGDRLRFLYQGKTRSLPLAQVEGLLLAARPESRADEPRQTFSLPGDVTVSGRWKDLDASVWKVEAPWGQELKLPAAEIQEVRFKGGKMTYLSDLDPIKVEETPFLGHRSPWRRDVGLTGEKLKMNDRIHERGIAVHSRSSLTYDLNGHYETFEALVGFDDAARGKGRVDCRIFADGKEIYANPDLRADGPPVSLKLSVASVEQLRLLIDFGRGQDTGDRVIWADARLYRQNSPQTGMATTTPNR